MNSLKVALISEEFPPFAFGGIASNCYDLAYSLSKKGIETTVFAGKSSKMSVEKTNDNLEVVRLPCLDLPPRFLWFQIQNFSTLSNLLKDYSIIHVVNPQSGAICAYIKKKLGKPLVTTIHGIHLNDLKTFVNSPVHFWTIGDLGSYMLEYPLIEFFTRQCLANSDHVIICGSYAFDEIERIYPTLNPEIVSVICNGINFDEIESESSVEDDSNGSTIIFYGRLHLGKGIIHLLKAIAMLVQDFPNLHLEIFGKGPLEQKIRGWVSTLGLKDKVNMRGYFQRVELLREIRKADIVALPSLGEVGPFIAALEAMACKKPIVAFDLPFTREFIKDMNNGILAKSGNIKDLSDKIAMLYLNGKLRLKLAVNAYKYVKDNHNWDFLVEKYIEVYKSVT